MRGVRRDPDAEAARRVGPDAREGKSAGGQVNAVGAGREREVEAAMDEERNVGAQSLPRGAGERDLLAVGSGLLAQPDRDGSAGERLEHLRETRVADRCPVRHVQRLHSLFDRVLPGSLETLREEAEVCDAGRQVDEAEARDEPAEESRAEKSGHRRAAGPRAQEEVDPDCRAVEDEDGTGQQ